MKELINAAFECFEKFSLSIGKVFEWAVIKIAEIID